MRIRNLTDYVANLTGMPPTEMLGRDKLLEKLQGADQNLEQHVGNLTSFATNSGEQIFYELLQNAEDAGAGQVLFFFEENNFLAINNGKPFWTDAPVAGEEREGQLKSFLAKGKGLKFGDPGTIGNKGQGSKLLYDLLLPRSGSDALATEHALGKAILKQRKAPILFSWNNLVDLERLQNWNGQPLETGSFSDENLPLLARLIYTYYPAMPGEKRYLMDGTEAELFPQDKLAQCVSFLQDCLPHLQLTAFPKGTLTYVPLGEGQAAHLESLLDNIKPGIANSLNLLNNLRRVEIQGKLVQKTADVRLLQLPTLELGEDKYSVKIAMLNAPASFQGNLCNFFQFFPITDTAYGLKFLFDTKGYGIDNARQRIDFSKPRNIEVLTKISQSIQEHLCQLRQTGEREGAIALLKCIVTADEITRPSLIEQLFYKNLLETAQENLPTQAGFADESTQVAIKHTRLSVSPIMLGINDVDWLATEFEDYTTYFEERLDLDAWTIKDLLEKAERTALSGWLKSLSVADYQTLLDEMTEQVKNYTELKAIPFLRFSDGEAQSLLEVAEDAGCLFLLPELQSLQSMLERGGHCCAGGLSDAPKLCEMIKASGNWKGEKYLQKFLEPLAKLPMSRDEKWVVFEAFGSADDGEDLLRNELLLFENQSGERRPLSRLLRHASELAPSGLLKRYSLKASENYFDELDEYFLPQDQIWQELLDDWEPANLPDINHFSLLVNDLNHLFNLAKEPARMKDDCQWIWTEPEKPASTSEVFFHQKLKEMEEPDYLHLSGMVAKWTNLRILPFTSISSISTVRFVSLPNTGLRMLAEQWTEDAQEVNKLDLGILKKIRLTGERVFDIFWISGEAPVFQLQKREGKDWQYFSEDRQLNNFLSGQPNYNLLPSRLLGDFQDDESLLRESEEFAFNLIDDFGANPNFIDLIIKIIHGERVRHKFLEELDRIDLFSGENPPKYEGTFEGKVIRLLAENRWENEFRNKIFVDNHRLEAFEFTDKVEVDIEEKSIRFSLSKLLPEMAGSSDVLTKVKNKFDGGFGQLFSTSRNYPKSDLAAQLRKLTTLENVEQLAFLIAFSRSKDCTLPSPEAILNGLDCTALSEQQALDIFFEKKLPFFSKYTLPPTWCSLPRCLDAPQFSLTTEQLPGWLVQWKNTVDIALKTQFLLDAGMQGQDSPVYIFRQKVADDETVTKELADELVLNSFFAANTFEWMAQRFPHTFLRESHLAQSVHKLAEAHISTQNELPPLLLSLFTKGETVELKFRKKGDWHTACFLEDEPEEARIWGNMPPEKIILEAKNHSKKFLAQLQSEGVAAAKITAEVSPNAEDGLTEWEDTRYLEWKKTDGAAYCIWHSPQEVPFDFYLETGEEKLPVGHFHTGKAERHEREGLNNLYLHRKTETEDILGILADHEEKLFGGDKSLLIKLLRLNLSNQNGSATLSEEINMMTSEGNPSSGTGKYDFDEPLDEGEHTKLNENLDLIKGLLEKAGREALEELLENWERIRFGEKDDDTTPNSLVGLIGERLVFLLLKKRNPEANYVAQVVKEYDIELPNGSKIDVKTTLKSVREADLAVPFFLQNSEIEYLRRKAPLEDYYIIRMSLKDLGLEDLYEYFKNKISEFKLSHEWIPEIDAKLQARLQDSTLTEDFNRNQVTIKMSMPQRKIEDLFI